ncbi:hypothetical protein Pla175_01900 [Pirellulimonas nuda]|uniref:Zinc-finger domain-containing protein n=1 Tax=Pirellulimonas nuda TaxID=2528009 RepID=A0A518D5T8_9BACT|nr:hypothetical protein [Pirellulimonas nuda]QDU86837.1 hypothetical protein Pla175_01900 [Pirellulimonas nuda]
MTHDPSPMAQADLEELVAYLDGELPPDLAAAVEDRLSRDAAYRAELQQLDRAWHALEELPKESVGDAFARTTIEMAAVQAEEDLAQLTAALPVRRRRRRWGMIAGGVAAALLGAVLARVATIRQEGPLVAGLPAIVEVDTLRQFDSVEFLAKLRDQGVFDDAALQRVDARAASWAEVAQADPLSRRAWIEALPADAQADLWEKSRRLAGFSELDQRRLAERERLLAANDDADTLRHTALAFQAFMSQRPPAEQSAIREMPLDERVERVAEMVRRDHSSTRQPLSAGEITRLRDAIRKLDEGDTIDRLPKLLRERVAELPKDFSLPWIPERRGQGSSGGNGSDNRRRFDVRRGMTQWADRLDRSPPWQIASLARISSSDEQPRALQMLLGDGYEAKIALLSQDWAKTESVLLEALDPATRERLNAASSERRRQRLSGYVMEVSRDRFEEELEQFFASDAITQEERQRLLAEPTPDLKEQLRELYLSRELSGLGDPAWLFGGGGFGTRGEGGGRSEGSGRGEGGGRNEAGGRDDRDGRDDGNGRDDRNNRGDGRPEPPGGADGRGDPEGRGRPGGPGMGGPGMGGPGMGGPPGFLGGPPPGDRPPGPPGRSGGQSPEGSPRQAPEG